MWRIPAAWAAATALRASSSLLGTKGSGSFTAAAARLELTPAAVSKNVMKLEAQVGVRLFNRTTRRLTLTAEGSAFAEQAREALRGLDDAVSAVSRAGGAVSGRVRISVGLGFGRTFVLPLAARLAAQHAALEVEVSLDNRNVDLVAEGFDIGVRGGTVVDSSLIARRVAKLPVVLVASPAYLSRHGVPMSVADLSVHQLLATRQAPSAVSPWRFHKASGRSVIDYLPPARVVTSDPEAQVDLALGGHGICQTGLWHVMPAHARSCCTTRTGSSCRHVCAPWSMRCCCIWLAHRTCTLRRKTHLRSGVLLRAARAVSKSKSNRSTGIKRP